MATIKGNFTDSQSITITLTSVTNTSFALSSAIDNSTNLFISALVQVTVKANASGTATTGYCNVWLARSADAGTTYDSTSTANKPGGLQLLGVIPVIANAETVSATFDTALLGALGTHWKIAVENESGATLDASVGSAKFSGVLYTSA